MTIVITKKSSGKQISAAKKKMIRKVVSKKGIANYFGALKRGLDGLQYQKDVRNEWH